MTSFSPTEVTFSKGALKSLAKFCVANDHMLAPLAPPQGIGEIWLRSMYTLRGRGPRLGQWSHGIVRYAGLFQNKILEDISPVLIGATDILVCGLLVKYPLDFTSWPSRTCFYTPWDALTVWVRSRSIPILHLRRKDFLGGVLNPGPNLVNYFQLLSYAMYLSQRIVKIRLRSNYRFS